MIETEGKRDNSANSQPQTQEFPKTPAEGAQSHNAGANATMGKDNLPKNQPKARRGSQAAPAGKQGAHNCVGGNKGNTTQPKAKDKSGRPPDPPQSSKTR